MYKIKRYSITDDLESLSGSGLPDEYFKLVDLEDQFNIKYILRGQGPTNSMNIPATVTTWNDKSYLKSIMKGVRKGLVALAYDENSVIYWNKNLNSYSIDQEVDYKTLKEAIVSLLDDNINEASDVSNSSIIGPLGRSSSDSVKLMVKYRNYIIRNLR